MEEKEKKKERQIGEILSKKTSEEIKKYGEKREIKEEKGCKRRNRRNEIRMR